MLAGRGAPPSRQARKDNKMSTIRSTRAFKDAVDVAFDTQTMKFTAAA